MRSFRIFQKASVNRQRPRVIHRTHRWTLFWLGSSVMTVLGVPSRGPSSPPILRATQAHITLSAMERRHPHPSIPVSRPQCSSCKRGWGSNLPYPDKLILPNPATPCFYQTRSRMPTGNSRWEARVPRFEEGFRASSTWTMTSRASSRISWIRSNRQHWTQPPNNHSNKCKCNRMNNKITLRHSIKWPKTMLHYLMSKSWQRRTPKKQIKIKLHPLILILMDSTKDRC